MFDFKVCPSCGNEFRSEHSISSKMCDTCYKKSNKELSPVIPNLKDILFENFIQQTLDSNLPLTQLKENLRVFFFNHGFSVENESDAFISFRKFGKPTYNIDFTPQFNKEFQSPQTTQTNSSSAITELVTLSNLFEKGMITEDEFKKMKQNIIQ